MSEQLDLTDWIETHRPPPSDRLGSTYDRALDFERLNGQAGRVWLLMKDGKKRTLREIGDETGDPEASISARLREYNDPNFAPAGVSMKKQRRGDPKRGCFEYWLEGVR